MAEMSIPTAVFKRRRGRETSARYSIRGAGGGGSLMARIGVRSGIGARRFLLQCRPLAAGGSLMARGNSRSRAGRLLPQRRALAACREDLISGLSDDLLLLILRRLDTRTALGAGSLSRRWAHLPRELSALDLKVGDVLPPRYHRWILLSREILEKGTLLHYGRDAVRQQLLPNIRRYERRAMRAFTSSAHSFLEGPRRRVNRLRLEFFITGSAAASCMNRLIAEAIDAWGVHDLGAVATPVCWQRDHVHSFPSHGLCKEPRASRLQSLKLGGCVLPPLHEYSRLTVLVLQDMPKSTPAAAYEGVFTSCPQLQAVHLISCGCSTTRGMPLTVVVDAPGSEIRELVVERCAFRWLVLRALPRLERLASLRSMVMFESTSFPCLRKWNLAECHGVDKELRRHLEHELGPLLGWVPPHVESFIIRFTGPYRWVVPGSSPSAAILPNLRRLLVADVPSSWDVTWPCPLLEMAPSLESLHINIASCPEEPDEEISWPPTELRQHHRLMEFVLAGFGGTTRQIRLVRFVVGACTALRHVALFKNGRPLAKGHWDWEMVTQQQSWTDEEKGNTLKQILDGVPSSTANGVQLVLG